MLVVHPRLVRYLTIQRLADPEGVFVCSAPPAVRHLTNLRMACPGGVFLESRMARMAILVDLAFFLKRYARIKRACVSNTFDARNTALAVWNAAITHARRQRDEIYRILVYDCSPLKKKAHNPVTGRSIDFSNTPEHNFRCALHSELIRLRKVALRLGELADRRRWIIRPHAMKRLLEGSLRLDQLQENDVIYDIEQKGVDIKIGIDIASIAYKKLAERIVLISGDSDFVPAAKLARREGLDFILDSLWAPITPSLNEHIDGLNSSLSRPCAPAKKEEPLIPSLLDAE